MTNLTFHQLFYSKSINSFFFKKERKKKLNIDFKGFCHNFVHVISYETHT